MDAVAGVPRFHVFINFFRYKEHVKRDDEAVLSLKGRRLARYVAAVHVRALSGRTDGRPIIKSFQLLPLVLITRYRQTDIHTGVCMLVHIRHNILFLFAAGVSNCLTLWTKFIDWFNKGFVDTYSCRYSAPMLLNWMKPRLISTSISLQVLTCFWKYGKGDLHWTQ